MFTRVLVATGSGIEKIEGYEGRVAPDVPLLVFVLSSSTPEPRNTIPDILDLTCARIRPVPRKFSAVAPQSNQMLIDEIRIALKG